MFILKILKKLVIAIVILSVVLIAGLFIYLNTVEVNITDDDLPENVYTYEGSLNILMLSTISDIVSNNGDRNERIEDYINLLIYKTIKDDINPDYNPINGETDQSQYITKNLAFQLDYIIANLTDDNQIMITVSLKRLTFPKAMTAIYFYFDMTFQSTTLTLALDQVYIDDQEISKSTYDYLVSMADKEKIESSIDKGTLNLDDYTYEINFISYIFGG